jgi:hypothetical protein
MASTDVLPGAWPRQWVKVSAGNCSTYMADDKRVSSYFLVISLLADP